MGSPRNKTSARAAAYVGVYKGAMHCLSKHSAISDIIRKAADLSNFDKGEIGMARRLGTSISETASLVGCSRAVVVSTNRKWCMDGETTSRRPAVCRPRSIPYRGERRLLPKSYNSRNQ